MKKVLAIVLVLAMVLGSVSMAFAANYVDQADITNTEAVNVLSMLKVLEGDANGFRPKDTLTRAEAAAICARLMLGREGADKLTAAGSSFTDVPASHWASGYIAYCVSQGIIAGNGDGTFDPEGVLTVAAFTKMMLCALGYNAQYEGLVGPDWEANTIGLAVEAGISVSATGACTREVAAQLGLNTLKADVVEYATAPVTVNAGGAQVSVGGSKATKKLQVAGSDYTPFSTTGDTYMQLVEKVYSADVTLDELSLDEFGNPATTWGYKTDTVTTSKKAVASYSKLMTSDANKKVIAADLKNYSFNGDKLTSVDKTSTTGGALGNVNFTLGNKIVDDLSAATGNGKLVEVFADDNKVITGVIITQYTLSKIASVTTNSSGDVTYTGSNGLTGKDYADATEDTIVINGKIAKDDYVTFVKPLGSSKTYVYPTTKITGTQTAKSNTALTIDGTSYTIANALAAPVLSGADFDNSSKAANYFLDQYGFVVASSEVESDLVFAVVDRIALKVGSGTSDSKTVEAVLVFTDGTKQTVSVSKIGDTKAANITQAAVGTADGQNLATSYVSNTAINGSIWSYEIDSDGKYAIKAPATTAAATVLAGDTIVTKGVAKVSGSAISGNADTVYIVKTLDGSDEKFNVYTGFANVPTLKASTGTVGAYAVADKNNAAKYVVIYVDATNGEVAGSTKNIFYATQAASAQSTNGTGSDVYYTLKGYLNGESTAIKYKSSTLASTAGVTKGSFWKLTIADDGNVSEFNAPGFTTTGTAVQADVDSVALGTLQGYTINGDTTTYVIDTDHVMSESDASVITSGANYFLNVYTEGSDAQKNTVKTLYIKLND